MIVLRINKERNSSCSYFNNSRTSEVRMAGANAQKISTVNVDHSSGDIYSGSFFEPDIMLPEQFNALEQIGIDGGERKLMAAILSDGVEAFLEQVHNHMTGKATRLDAIDWVEVKDSEYVFSFDNVCSALGINPEFLRLGLSRYVTSLKSARIKNELDKITWKKIRRPRSSNL